MKKVLGATIASLLLRFWDPDEGAVRLAGVDVRKLTLEGLRERIALVAQDTYLFNDTLEANIRLARPGASDALIERALEQGVVFVAGSAFHVDGSGHNTIRLSFSEGQVVLDAGQGGWSITCSRPTSSGRSWRRRTAGRPCPTRPARRPGR